MAESMMRTQLLLEPEQHRTLAQIAQEEDRSISDLVREILREALVEREKIQRQEKAAEALQRLNQLREAGPVYLGDPIAEIRAERTRQVDTIWQES